MIPPHLPCVTFSSFLSLLGTPSLPPSGFPPTCPPSFPLAPQYPLVASFWTPFYLSSFTPSKPLFASSSIPLDSSPPNTPEHRIPLDLWIFPGSSPDLPASYTDTHLRVFPCFSSLASHVLPSFPHPYFSVTLPRFYL